MAIDLNMLKEIKENVSHWSKYWKMNTNSFHYNRTFVYKSSLNDMQQQELGSIDRPAFEFNVLEAYLSRNIGEFAKQEPSFIVHEAPDSPNVDPAITKFIEGHFQSILYQSRREQFEQQIFDEIQSGGFSAFKVELEYSNPYTFNQEIRWRKLFDPTLAGWDPVARTPHKGDGDFAFEIFPLTERALKSMNKDIDFKSVTPYTFGDFTWAYKYGQTQVVLMCNYYQKDKTNKMLCYLADNSAMLERDYKELLAYYRDTNQTAQPPICIKRRKTEITEIKKYKLIYNDILSEEKTLFTELPVIFVNGNSKMLREGGIGSSMTEFTRPYFYQAMDAQKLKNIAGQALANELEGLVQHKFIAPLEGIPEQYTEAYKKPQKANTLVYKSFLEDGITPIQPPREVQRPPIPPEVSQTFQAADPAIQNILGAYSPQPDTPNQLSGVAIAQAALQSSAAGEPYINNYLISLNQAATLTLAVMPKVYFNPRSLMSVDKQRNKAYVPVNGFAGSGLSMKFNAASMNVIVEAGANFEVQKNTAIQMMTMLAQTFPALNQLINSKGLKIVLDNLSFRGVEELKEAAGQMMQEEEEKAKTTPPPPDPNTLKAMDIQMRGQDNQARQQIEGQKLQQNQQQMQLDSQKDGMEMQVEIKKAQDDKEIEIARLHLEATIAAHEHERSLHEMRMAEHDHIHKVREHGDKMVVAEKAATAKKKEVKSAPKK